MNMDDSRHCKWLWNEATEPEKQLVEKVYELEAFFGDMLFEKGSNTYDLIKCKSKGKHGEEWTDDVMGLPEELEYFSPSWFIFKVEDQQDGSGYFEESSQTLCITPESLEKDHVILHEMIHMHEYAINGLPTFFHDMVYWALYKSLKDKVPNIDEIISNHARLVSEWVIQKCGGTHDILFLLKSFDLDLRKGYPLGTVFGYDDCRSW